MVQEAEKTSIILEYITASLIQWIKFGQCSSKMKQPHLQTLNWISFQGLTRDKEGLQHLHLQSNLVKLTNCQHKDIRYIRIYKISLWFQGMVALCCFMLLYVPFPSFPQIDIWASNAIGLLPFHHYLKPNGRVHKYFKANSTPGSLRKKQTSLVSILIIRKGHVRHLAHEQIHQPCRQIDKTTIRKT